MIVDEEIIEVRKKAAKAAKKRLKNLGGGRVFHELALVILMKGIRGEREFVNLLRNQGIVAIRIPASGAARKDVLPDVIAAYRGRIALFEVKHAQQAYIPKKRLEALRELAEHFNGKAFIAFRPKGSSDYYIIPVENSPTTITPEKAKSFEHIDAFIREYFFREPSVLDMI